jgi:uncharacterized protein
VSGPRPPRSSSAKSPTRSSARPECGTGHGSQALLQTFTDVSRFWTINNFQILDIFGSDNRVAAFGTFTYTSSVLGREVTSPFAVLAKIEGGKVVYTQFMEDSFATARSFRSGGTWTIRSNPTGLSSRSSRS